MKSTLTLLPLLARTATEASLLQVNEDYVGAIVQIKVTAVTDTPSVVFTIQGHNEVTGDYYTILTSVAVTGTGTTTLRVFPGYTPVANTVVDDVLPRNWRVNAVHGDADSITYSVSAIPLTR